MNVDINRLCKSILELFNQVQPCSFYSIQDTFKRTIKFSKDVDKSTSIYPYVFLSHNSSIGLTLYNSVTFGCIQMIFKHSFGGKLPTLVYSLVQ